MGYEAWKLKCRNRKHGNLLGKIDMECSLK